MDVSALRWRLLSRRGFMNYYVTLENSLEPQGMAMVVNIGINPAKCPFQPCGRVHFWPGCTWPIARLQIPLYTNQYTNTKKYINKLHLFVFTASLLGRLKKGDKKMKELVKICDWQKLSRTAKSNSNFWQLH